MRRIAQVLAAAAVIAAAMAASQLAQPAAAASPRSAVMQAATGRTAHPQIVTGQVQPEAAKAAAAQAADDTASVQLTRAPSRRWRAFLWALRQQGCWYQWGGAGPCSRGYDCSGLVVAAYASQGIYLPHNTYAMLGSGRLTQIPESQARAGDLVFMYGGGHVEMVTRWWRFNAYGAHTAGTRVGFDNWSSVLGFYHVTGSG